MFITAIINVLLRFRIFEALHRKALYLTSHANKVPPDSIVTINYDVKKFFLFEVYIL